MLDLSDADLLFRLGNVEDSLVERKTSGDSKDWLKTVVAFANSAPLGAPAVLFIGVKDDGNPEDKPINWDSLQKTLGEKLSAAYPTIPYVTKILAKEGKQFLAVMVEGSPARPHFAGPSYVRDGSSSKVASRDQFEKLITERNSQAYEILKWKGSIITVDVMSMGRRREVVGPVASSEACTVLDCNDFYVTLKGSTFQKSVPLARVQVSFDDQNGRLRLEEWPER